MELLQKYIKEIEQDLKIDEFNVKEVQTRKRIIFKFNLMIIE